MDQISSDILMLGGFRQSKSSYLEAAQHFEIHHNKKLKFDAINQTSRLKLPPTALSLDSTSTLFRKKRATQSDSLSSSPSSIIRVKSLTKLVSQFLSSGNSSIICHSSGLYYLQIILKTIELQFKNLTLNACHNWPKYLAIYSFGSYDYRIIGNINKFNKNLSSSFNHTIVKHYPVLGITKATSENASNFFKENYCKFYKTSQDQKIYEPCLGDGLIPYSHTTHRKEVIYLNDVQHSSSFGKRHYFCREALIQWKSIIELSQPTIN